MTGLGNVCITQALTPKDFQKCLDVRYQVFIIEQKYPAEIENDGMKTEWMGFVSTKWLFVTKKNEDGTVDSEHPIGTIRMIPKPDGVAKLGRLAVLSEARGLYIGQKLVRAFVEYCKENNSYHTIMLNSQNDKSGFYEKLGFIVEEGDDEVFIEEGTPHIRMWMKNL